MRKTLLSALAVTILLGMSSIGPAQAQESGLKPILTVTLSGVDAIKKDLGVLFEASGTAEMAQPLEQIPLPGLDTSKPWGVVVQTDGQKFPVFVFVPVTDLTHSSPSIGDR